MTNPNPVVWLGKGGLEHKDVDYSQEITKDLKHTGKLLFIRFVAKCRG